MTKTAPVLQTYQQRVSRTRFLSAEDEARLVALIRGEPEAPRAAVSTASSSVEAKAALVAAHLPIVPPVARRYTRRATDFDDLVQEGNLALLAAASRFAKTGRGRFGPFAIWWVRAAIARAANRSGYPVELPERLARKLSGYQRRRLPGEQLPASQHEPTRSALNATMAEWKAILTLGEPSLLLSAPVGDGGLTLGDCLYRTSESDSVSTEGENSSAHVGLQAYLANANLTKTERRVVRLHHNLGDPECASHAFDEVAQILGVSPDKVADLHRQAVERAETIWELEAIRGRAGPRVQTLTPARRPVVSEMAPRQRRVFLLQLSRPSVWADDLPFKTVGEILGLSEERARQLYHRAISKLRLNLDGPLADMRGEIRRDPMISGIEAVAT